MSVEAHCQTVTSSTQLQSSILKNKILFQSGNFEVVISDKEIKCGHPKTTVIFK